MNDILTITELNILLKDSIKKLPKVKVKGELGGFRGKYNNTIYANLKDNISSINIIRFKATEDIKNGDKLVVSGVIDFYSKTGDIKLICNSIEVEGEGNIFKKLELIKNKYEEKGYFNNKKSFPKIKNIGIITSKDGAALQDILFVFNNNKFENNIFIKNSLVQGNDCVKGLCNGIKFFNTFLTKENLNVDLIMITRGGGNIDDLMGFSDPNVLEEIHNSNIFVMSAVGHEIDWMLSDYVADIRAPTPSIGAEMICKSCQNYKQKIEIFTYKDETYQQIIKTKFDMIRKNINIYRKMMYINKYQFNKKNINLIHDKITNLLKNKFNFIKNVINTLKSNIYIIKNHNFNSDCNCVIKSKNKIIKNIDEIQNGTYTIEINKIKKKIEIKIL